MADHGAKVYDHFYRCLIVQHILQHIRRRALNNASIGRIQQETRGPRFKPEKDSWHIFLDSLSVLCDYKTGGESVTAIAAERNYQSKSNKTFWILVNGQQPESETASRASSHLTALLGSLHQITQGGKANE